MKFTADKEHARNPPPSFNLNRHELLATFSPEHKFPPLPEESSSGSAKWYKSRASFSKRNRSEMGADFFVHFHASPLKNEDNAA
jgi:hypothetical protein